MSGVLRVVYMFAVFLYGLCFYYFLWVCVLLFLVVVGLFALEGWGLFMVLILSLGFV